MLRNSQGTYFMVTGSDFMWVVTWHPKLGHCTCAVSATSPYQFAESLYFMRHLAAKLVVKLLAFYFGLSLDNFIDAFCISFHLLYLLFLFSSFNDYILPYFLLFFIWMNSDQIKFSPQCTIHTTYICMHIFGVQWHEQMNKLLVKHLSISLPSSSCLLHCIVRRADLINQSPPPVGPILCEVLGQSWVPQRSQVRPDDIRPASGRSTLEKINMITCTLQLLSKY